MPKRAGQIQGARGNQKGENENKLTRFVKASQKKENFEKLSVDQKSVVF